MQKKKESREIVMDLEADSNLSLKLSEKNFSRLSVLALQQIQLEDEIDSADEARKKLSKDLDEIKLDLLPVLMKEIGVLSFTLNNGAGVSTREVIKASISKANEEEAFIWLRKNKHGGLIKNEVTVRFKREEDKLANNLLKEMERRDLDVNKKTGVNSNTLSAFVREQMEEGVNIPLDLLGVFMYNEAKIKRPTIKRGKNASKKG